MENEVSNTISDSQNGNVEKEMVETPAHQDKSDVQEENLTENRRDVMFRLLQECPVEEDYENLPEEVFDPVKEGLSRVYRRYMHCEDGHAVIDDNTAIVNVYNPLKVTVRSNHGKVNVFGNNIHAEIITNDGHVRICSNNSQVFVGGDGTVDVMGHGNEVNVVQGIVHIYGEDAVAWVFAGVADIHSEHSKVYVHHGLATVMNQASQELECTEAGELILPANSSKK